MKNLKTIGVGPANHVCPAAESATTRDFAAKLYTDVGRTAALPASEQLEEVRNGLIYRGYGGQLTQMIESRVVTELSVNTIEVTDVTPTRAIAKLIYLDGRATNPNWGILYNLTQQKECAFKIWDWRKPRC